MLAVVDGLAEEHSRFKTSVFEGSTILGRVSVVADVLGREMIESSERAVSGRKAFSISPVESSVRIKSRKNFILTLPSRKASRPIPLNSKSIFFLAASERDRA